MSSVVEVFLVFEKIYQLAEQAKANKANCQKAAARCRSVEVIIQTCVKESKRYGGLNDEQQQGFERLRQHLNNILDLFQHIPNKMLLCVV